MCKVKLMFRKDVYIDPTGQQDHVMEPIPTLRDSVKSEMKSVPKSERVPDDVENKSIEFCKNIDRQKEKVDFTLTLVSVNFSVSNLSFVVSGPRNVKSVLRSKFSR